MKRAPLAILLSLAAMAVGASTASAATSTAGSVLWSADTTSSLSNEWYGISVQGHCGVRPTSAMSPTREAIITDSTSPSPTGRAYQMTVDNGDNCYGARSELDNGQGDPGYSKLFYQGNDDWISYAIRLAPNFPTTTNAWQVVSQWKQTAGYPGGNNGNSPKFALEVRNKQWQMVFMSNNTADQANVSEGNHTDVFGGAPVTNRWVKLTLHVVFGDSASTGEFTLYGDMGDGQGWRTLIPLENTPTLYQYAGAAIPANARIGIYRDPTAYSADTYDDFAGYTVATTRAAAEAKAFGTTAPVVPVLKAAFTAPATSKIGQAVKFDTSGSTGSPTSYTWTDANGNESLGTGGALSYTFHYAGTKKVTLTVKDASGAVSTAEHNLTVS